MNTPSDAAPALRAMRRQLMRISGDLSKILAELEPHDTPVNPRYQGLARTESIMQVLDAHEGPMTPVAIWRALAEAGCNDEKNLVRVTTYQLWRRGRLVKLGRGMYCHPRHVPRGAVIEPYREEAPQQHRAG
jgi:hypothetical protein